MKCARCQTEVSDEGKFCPKCGAGIAQPVGVASAPVRETAASSVGAGGTLFGFELGEVTPAVLPTDGVTADPPTPLASYPGRHVRRDRPAMQSLADFGKLPAPATPPPVNWTRRGVVGAAILGSIGGLVYLGVVAGQRMAEFYSGAEALRGTDRFGNRR